MLRLLASVIAIFLLLLSSSSCRAQDEDELSPIARTRLGDLDVTSVRPAGAAQVLREGRARVLALEGSLPDWENETADGTPVLEKLQDWTRRGGIVILHTDVAQSFGFRVLPARGRTRVQAGQLFGRARSALHFGMHPTLWGGKSSSSEGATFASLGVRIVFYQLQQGDCLVLSHPDGVPLLRVTDLARPVIGISGSGQSGFKERYAAAMAPYGRGWALVLPRVIDQRADGEKFVTNVAALLENLAAKKWNGMPTPPIERAYDRWRRRYRIDWARVATEIRRGLNDDNVEAAPEKVAQMLERDTDQTFSPEQVAAHFGRVRADVRTAKEVDFYQAIANATEGAKRRRLLYLATSRFRLLLPKSEIERSLEIFERAAREQTAQNLRAAKLPVSTDNSSEIPAAAIDEGFGAQNIADGDDESDDSEDESQDEKLYQSYRAAAAQMFVLRTHLMAQRDFSAPIITGNWTRQARRVGMPPAEYWLWRGLLTAGEIDDTKINTWLRLSALGDAAVSWQNALQSSPEQALAPDPETPDTVPAEYQLFGGEAATALREKTLQAQELQARQASNDAPQVLATASKDVVGVPRELLASWIADALSARALLARDAPLGAEMPRTVAVRSAKQIQNLDNLNNGSAFSSGMVPAWVSSQMRPIPEIPQRGWIEDSTTLQPYRRDVLIQNGMNETAAIVAASRFPDLPSSNRPRPSLIARTAETLRLHSGMCVFGWNTDAEDITMTPSLGAMRSLAGGIHQGFELEWAVRGNSFSNQGPTAVEHSIMRQMERERIARIRAELPPQVALAGVRYTGSANTGFAMGTRIFIPTAPDQPIKGLNWGLEKRQIRMMIGIPTALAKAHADVLINTITEGGTPPPQWMRDGFVSLSRQYMARAMTDISFPTNGYFRAIPLGFLLEIDRHGTQFTPKHNYLDYALDPDDKIEPDKIDIWWANDRDYFTTCAQLAVLGLPENPGTTLLPRLYQEIGSGGVTEIMQRLGAGQTVDEAFWAVTGYGEKQWVARAMSRRAGR